MINTRILLISDHPETGRIWSYALAQRGVQAVLVESAEEALNRWVKDVFDLTVIDVHTSQLNGIELCRRLRFEAVVPVLLFTPRSDEAHVLEAYQAGVDECVVTPISPPVFLAKVKAWLRHSRTVSTKMLEGLQVGEFRLDPNRREVVTASAATVKLSNLEFRLLHLLMVHRGQVLESDLLVDRVWGYIDVSNHALLKNAVYRLRHKIEDTPSQPRYIQTVAGIGYTFQAE